MLRDKNLVLAGPCSHLSVEKEWYSLKVTFSSSHVRKKTLILWHRKGESKKNYLLPFTATKEVLKLAMFQYKITHNILATNSILYKMKKVASPSCPFCPSVFKTCIICLSAACKHLPFGISSKDGILTYVMRV